MAKSMQVGDVEGLEGLLDIGGEEVMRPCGLGLACCDSGKQDVVCDAYADWVNV